MPNEAFDYSQGAVGENSKKAILAVAFLIEWATDVGNEDLEGNAAAGLARILRQVADRRPLKRPALRAAGDRAGFREKMDSPHQRNRDQVTIR